MSAAQAMREALDAGLGFPRVAAGGVVGALVLLGFVWLVLQAMENV